MMLLDRFNKGQHSPRTAQSFGDKLATFSPQSLARNFSDEVKLPGSFISERTILFHDDRIRR